MKKLSIIFIMALLCINFCHKVYSYDLDLSINDEIEKKYNSEKLNKEMNQTNKNIPTSQPKSVPKTLPSFDNQTVPIVKNNINTVKNNNFSGIFIPKGTKFSVKSNSKISDWTNINSQVSFTTISPVTKNNITIPTGTTFKGQISSLHHPQISGNGALIEIKITSLVYNGKSYFTQGKITKVNSRNIFFNKIKGQRKYIAGVKNKINSANNFYKKSRNLSSKLSSNPVGTILSPIPTIIGALGATTATIISPISGIVQKGSSISIPQGTIFEIKLLEDSYLN